MNGYFDAVFPCDPLDTLFELILPDALSLMDLSASAGSGGTSFSARFSKTG